MKQGFNGRTRIRKNFGSIREVLEMPNLIDVQMSSYERFLQKDVPSEKRDVNVGLEAVFRSIFPLKDYSKDGIFSNKENISSAELEYISYDFDEPKNDVDECRQRDMTFGAPLKVTLRLIVFDVDEDTKNRSVKDIKEQEVYMGDLPLMTDTGTFVVNGAERVVVSQMHRSPGVFFDHDNGKSHSSGKILFAARVIPYRGSWLDFEFDAKDLVYARIDRKRKFPVTTLMMALGLNPEDILKEFYESATYKFVSRKGKNQVASIKSETEQVKTSESMDVFVKKIKLMEEKITRKQKNINDINIIFKNALIYALDTSGKYINDEMYKFLYYVKENIGFIELQNKTTQTNLKSILKLDSELEEVSEKLVFPKSIYDDEKSVGKTLKEVIANLEEKRREISMKIHVKISKLNLNGMQVSDSEVVNYISNISREKIKIKNYRNDLENFQEGEFNLLSDESEAIYETDYFRAKFEDSENPKKVMKNLCQDIWLHLKEIENIIDEVLELYGNELESLSSFDSFTGLAERISEFDLESDKFDIKSSEPDRLSILEDLKTFLKTFTGFTPKKRNDTKIDSKSTPEQKNNQHDNLWIVSYEEKRFMGLTLSEDMVNASDKKVLAKAGERFNRRLARKIEEQHVTDLLVSHSSLIGKYFAEDIVNLKTGEILAEAGDEVTEETLASAINHKHEEISLLEIDHVNIGPYIRNTLKADKAESREQALYDIYKIMRPGEPPILETAEALFESLFFDSERYDLSSVGRVKMNMRLNIKCEDTVRNLRNEDILSVIKTLVNLRDGKGEIDDIDNLGNRRVRSVGELMENQYRLGLTRMVRPIVEKMRSSEIGTVMPQDLINAKPAVAAIREFFGSSQLSQYMDQTNPLSEITHKRRVSALGPGGLTRERAGFEVRDVHTTHYGRLCPIETPEGQNIGLISSLATFAKVNKYGFIESPYRKVVEGKITDDVVHLSAMEESKYNVAQADVAVTKGGDIEDEFVVCRHSGEVHPVPREKVGLMDVSPKQVVSVAASLIPFLENDDANRALMGSNMQRQAVPLLKSEAPLVGTGMEKIVAKDSGATIVAKRAGIVDQVDAERIVIEPDDTRISLEEKLKKNKDKLNGLREKFKNLNFTKKLQSIEKKISKKNTERKYLIDDMNSTWNFLRKLSLKKDLLEVERELEDLRIKRKILSKNLGLSIIERELEISRGKLKTLLEKFDVHRWIEWETLSESNTVNQKKLVDRFGELKSKDESDEYLEETLEELFRYFYHNYVNIKNKNTFKNNVVTKKKNFQELSDSLEKAGKNLEERESAGFLGDVYYLIVGERFKSDFDSARSDFKSALRQIKKNFCGKFAELIVESALEPLGDFQPQSRKFLDDDKLTIIDVKISNLKKNVNPSSSDDQKMNYAKKGNTLAVEVKTGIKSTLIRHAKIDSNLLKNQTRGLVESADASMVIFSRDLQELDGEGYENNPLRVNIKKAGSFAFALLPKKEKLDNFCKKILLSKSDLKLSEKYFVSNRISKCKEEIEDLEAAKKNLVSQREVKSEIEKLEFKLKEEEEKRTSEPPVDIYELKKYQRSNQNTCINQRPIVKKGERVSKGDFIADGPCTDQGELALGKNVLVAFMPWNGYNFEDSILLSERIVRDDVFTSIHLEEFEVAARDTKLGPEEITRDIPNVSDEQLKNLDEAGIIDIGAEVKAGDILVGKITPKGETPITPEEKLLRAIFGEKASDVRDTSLRIPPGVSGTVVEVRVFNRYGVEKDERAIAIERAEIERLSKNHYDVVTIVNRSMYKRLAELVVGRKATSGPDGFKKNSFVTVDTLHNFQQSQWWNFAFSDEKLMGNIERLRKQYYETVEDLQKRFDDKVEKLQRGDELMPGVMKMVKVFVAVKRKLQPGDKMAGRHGNKGVVSKINPIEDMPFLEDGTPIDIVLNPLGVPSRMNVGQILETHLGWACEDMGKQIGQLYDQYRKSGEIEQLRTKISEIYGESKSDVDLKEFDDESIVKMSSQLKKGVPIATPVFDGAKESDVSELLDKGSLGRSGQATLYDGRTGEPFERKVTVGNIYILKLHHLVDEKIHSRSIGPYSLVTQQPLGGKAQFGGQRFGEMEVWALEAYGAAYTLQEMLTIKSDDVAGRTKVYEAIVKGDDTFEAGIPESFNVLVKEMRSLGLNVELNDSMFLERFSNENIEFSEEAAE